MTVNENILFSASSLKNDRFINSLFKSTMKSKIEQELNEKKKKGLWANIRAKKKRGEKSDPRSKEYKAAKKAGQRINRAGKKK